MGKSLMSTKKIHSIFDPISMQLIQNQAFKSSIHHYYTSIDQIKLNLLFYVKKI